MRGKWILENLLGTPPPPPPQDVPPLKENEEGDKPLTMREQMEEHRANPVCASCHKVMDPIGFALENFDAVGAWRTRDAGEPIDASGQLADGTTVDGVVALRQALLKRPDVFVGTMTEKMLTYALGRGVEDYDMPAVRAIVGDAATQDYRFSSLVLGIVKSAPFQMRMKATEPSSRHRSTGEHSCSSQRSRCRPPDVPARHGRDARAAVARRDGARRCTALAQTAGEPARCARLRLLPERRRHGQWMPAQRAASFEFTPILKPLEPFRESADRRQQPARAAGTTIGDHAVSGRRLAERRLREADRGRGHPRRRHDRSDRREADRPGHAVPVARSGDRGLHRLRRRLHARASAAPT